MEKTKEQLIATILKLEDAILSEQGYHIVGYNLADDGSIIEPVPLWMIAEEIAAKRQLTFQNS